jgi:hypothetical protein
MRQLKSAELEHWRGLASEAMIELGRAVLQHGTAKHQSTFLLVATNSIHCYWTAAGSLTQLHCKGCDEPRSLGHLLDCVNSFSGLTLRRELTIAIRGCFAAAAGVLTRAWLRATHVFSLRELLASLFPIPATASDEEQDRHFTCLLVGAFTRRQANAAAKSAGFASGDDGRDCLLRLRLLCLEHIARFFGRWKEAACA